MTHDDVPAVGKSHPGLRLPADLAGRGVAMKQRRGHRKVAAIGGDDRFREPAGEADGRAGGAEGRDLVVAIEDLLGAVADGARVDAEDAVEHRDVVGHQRLFVAVEGRRNLGHDLRQIDFHGFAPSCFCLSAIGQFGQLSHGGALRTGSPRKRGPRAASSILASRCPQNKSAAAGLRPIGCSFDFAQRWARRSLLTPTRGRGAVAGTPNSRSKNDGTPPKKLPPPPPKGPGVILTGGVLEFFGAATAMSATSRSALLLRIASSRWSRP